LSKKLKFWRDFIEEETTSFWLPAFFDPRALLGALIQTRARLEGIPFTDIRNEFDVLESADDIHPEKPTKNVAYLYGMSLEGAQWSTSDKLLVEPHTQKRFNAFPGLRVRTIRISDMPVATLAKTLENFGESAMTFRLTKKKILNKKLES